MSRSTRYRRLLPFSPSTTPLHAATYLLGISLFSIAFLVFLNSAVSFVVTDLLDIKTGVGGVVGTLGFVDEVVALAACPLWGLASDRLGVRWVAVIGYGVIGLALFVFVQARTVAGLVAGRVLFALGASAAATMVTAALPVLTGDDDEKSDEEEGDRGQEGVAAPVVVGGDEEEEIGSPNSNTNGRSGHNPRGSIATSLGSDATITPERFTREQQSSQADGHGASDAEGESDEDDHDEDDKGRKPSALAGYVGLFTGCGALVALALFLPLPARFSQRDGVTPAQAITWSFYVVGAVAFVVAFFVFLGFRGLKGEEEKGWRLLLGLRSSSDSAEKKKNNNRTAAPTPGTVNAAGGGPSYAEVAASSPPPPASSAPRTSDSRNRTSGSGPPLPYRHLLLASLRLGLTDPHIALGYLGGFVARASTVAISLFVPLYVNAYFIGHGFCRGSPDDPSPDLKRECRAAYVLASALTGAAQLVALLCAPLFGYLSGRSNRGRRSGSRKHNKTTGRRILVGERSRSGVDVNFPVLVAASFGVVGYAAFPQLPSPEFVDRDGRGGSPAVFLIAALLGVSQIGAIVCSLGSLGRGVLGRDVAVPAERRKIERRDDGYGYSHGGDDGDDDATAVEAGETDALLSGPSENANGSGNGRWNTASPSESQPSPSPPPPPSRSRVHLKGSIAGVYSLCGGAAILLLTKLGGFLFDAASPGAPFYMMAGFNGALFVVSLGIDLFGRKRV
ncbi:hypothetical protein SLS62_007395 [Diatrype stigma]|uniref:Uncharacterized protein n=1 Tax=Diatrype stigma TaxID=117547 RepID=A0AAN9YQT3_9PEZI